MLLTAVCRLLSAPVNALGGSRLAADPAATAAASAGPIDMRRSTKHISNSFVADSSSEQTYNPKLCPFTCWLVDNHRDYINPALLSCMIELDETDSNNHKY